MYVRMRALGMHHVFNSPLPSVNISVSGLGLLSIFGYVLVGYDNQFEKLLDLGEQTSAD
jgi:hypothetical protein